MVLLKADLLRRGIRVERPRGSGDSTPIRLQGSIELPGGVFAFAATNPSSPYLLVPQNGDGPLTLGVSGKDGFEPITDVKPGPRFRWTAARTSRGTPINTLFSPSLGGACGPLAVFLIRNCELAAAGEECRFCSYVHDDRVSVANPDVDDMREAMTAIRNEQRTMGYLAFSGGSLFDRTREADAYIRCMEAVRATGATLPATVAAIQALDRVDSWRLRNAGFDYACYSMDVWDRRLWPEVVPGKSRSLGREKWMARLQDAVDVFGKGRVLCNFVAGVEVVAPGRFSSVVEAVESTLDGMRWCCERGVYPKYASWIVTANSKYAERGPAPLEYFVRLMVGRQQLFREYDLRVPATECQRCLTQSFEADLARLDPARYGAGAAGIYQWHKAHPPAVSLN